MEDLMTTRTEGLPRFPFAVVGACALLVSGALGCRAHVHDPDYRPPPGPNVLHAKEVKAKRIRARVIYAKEVKAEGGSIGRVYGYEGGGKWGGGEVKVPELVVDTIYAKEVKAEWLEADEVHAKEVKFKGTYRRWPFGGWGGGDEGKGRGGEDRGKDKSKDKWKDKEKGKDKDDDGRDDKKEKKEKKGKDKDD
jgi:hypothetical protein